MKRNSLFAMSLVAVLAAIPMGLAVAWEADMQHQAWRNDTRPPLDSVKCANAQEAWLADPHKLLNIDMSHPGVFRWSLTQVHAQMVQLCK